VADGYVQNNLAKFHWRCWWRGSYVQNNPPENKHVQVKIMGDDATYGFGSQNSSDGETAFYACMIC
jgi:hypothetical protein